MAENAPRKQKKKGQKPAQPALPQALRTALMYGGYRSQDFPASKPELWAALEKHVSRAIPVTQSGTPQSQQRWSFERLVAYAAAQVALPRAAPRDRGAPGAPTPTAAAATAAAARPRGAPSEAAMLATLSLRTLEEHIRTAEATLGLPDGDALVEWFQRTFEDSMNRQDLQFLDITAALARAKVVDEGLRGRVTELFREERNAKLVRITEMTIQRRVALDDGKAPSTPCVLAEVTKKCRGRLSEPSRVVVERTADERREAVAATTNLRRSQGAFDPEASTGLIEGQLRRLACADRYEPEPEDRNNLGRATWYRDAGAGAHLGHLLSPTQRRNIYSSEGMAQKRARVEGPG